MIKSLCLLVRCSFSTHPCVTDVSVETVETSRIALDAVSRSLSKEDKSEQVLTGNINELQLISH